MCCAEFVTLKMHMHEVIMSVYNMAEIEKPRLSREVMAWRKCVYLTSIVSNEIDNAQCYSHFPVITGCIHALGSNSIVLLASALCPFKSWKQILFCSYYVSCGASDSWLREFADTVACWSVLINYCWIWLLYETFVP